MTRFDAPPPILLTPAEASVILGRTVEELRRWRATNEGPAFYDLGDGLIRYRRASVLAHILDVGPGVTPPAR
ncbi:helix-turn-helix transcriptional regulator [Micromonospora sp. DT81.3]|uniref:helix-turn-helix transcriptional regulator n=1 Tax=Micromonospora sp. DT81.3 TaxID=3416523 RepID=UPI003CF958C7